MPASTNSANKLFLFVFFALFFLGCAQTPIRSIDSIDPMPADQYADLIKRHTTGTRQYAGFHQTFQAELTILTSEVLSAGLRQKAAFLQWNQKQYQSEREKSLQEANAYSRFFLRYFSPDREYDDLHKGKSIWKIFLEVSGSRFEGKVVKMSEKAVEISTLYPHMDRFSTAYEVTFNVPMTTVEQGLSKVFLTSSLGQAEFSYPVKK
jgi:hypothetical protein